MDMYTIGEFSKKLEIISVETLRHYDEIGLFKPYYVDKFTHYRYYTDEQIDKVIKIFELKEYGFSLDAIQQILNTDDSTKHIEAFEQKTIELGIEINNKTKAKRLLSNKLNRLKGITEIYNKNVLIIDDSDFMREIVRKILEEVGYAVFDAENGKMGLELAETQKPNLILLDMGMPEMDGIQVLKELQLRGSTATIVMLTANSTINTVLECLSLGVQQYVAKPFRGEYLLLALNECEKSYKINTNTATLLLKKHMQIKEQMLENLNQDEVSWLQSICEKDFCEAEQSFLSWLSTGKFPLNQ